MKGMIDSLINILIQKGVLVKKRHIKQISKIFLNKDSLRNFIEDFIKQKEYFLETYYNKFISY